jgi:hypothetical protein
LLWSESYELWEHNGDVFLQRAQRVNVRCGLNLAADLFFPCIVRELSLTYDDACLLMSPEKPLIMGT